MANKVNQSVLDDFIVTTNNHPDFDDNKLMELFPEFENRADLLDAAFSYKATKTERNFDEPTLQSKFPEFFTPAQPVQPVSSQPSSAQPAGVSGGSLSDEQAELARQNAYQGATSDPNKPFVASQDENQAYQEQMLRTSEAMRHNAERMAQRTEQAAASMPQPSLSLAPKDGSVGAALERMQRERLPEIRKHTIANNMLNETYQERNAVLDEMFPIEEYEKKGAKRAEYGVLAQNDPYLRAANNILMGAQIRMDDTKRQNGVSWSNVGNGIVSFAKDAARHLLGDMEGILSFGTSDMRDAMIQREVLKKVADAGAYDTPEQVLTPQERVLYDAITTNIAVEIARQNDTSRWSKAGQITADMIPFIADIMAGNALFKGMGKAARRAITQSVEKAVKNKLAKWLLTNVGDVAVSAGESAMTASILPRTYSKMYENAAQVDTDKLGMEGDFRMKIGNIKQQGMGDAWGNAYRDQVKELFTETGGNFRLIGRALIDNPLGKKILKTPFGMVLKRFEGAQGGAGSRFASMTMYHGVLGEWLEELEGAIYDGNLKEFFTADTQLPMLLSFSVPAAFIGGLNAGQHAYLDAKYKSAGKTIDKLIDASEYVGPDKNTLKGQIMATLYQTPTENLPQAIGMCVEQVYPEEYKALMEGAPEKGNKAAELAYALKEYLASGTVLTAFDPDMLGGQIADVQAHREQMRQQATEAAQAAAQNISHEDGNIYRVTIKGKDDVAGYAFRGDLDVVPDKDGAPTTRGRDLITIKMDDGTTPQVPADELVILDAPQSAQERIEQMTEHYFAQYANNDLFHVGDKVYIKQNGQQSAESSTIVNINDEGIEVEIIDPNGQPNTTVIPHEQAAEALAVAEGETEDNIVTYNVNGNELRLRDLGNGTYETLDAEEGAAPHRFTDADLAQLGAQRVEQPVSGQPPMQGAQPPLQQAPMQNPTPQAPMQPVATPQQPQFGSNAPGIDELSAEDFAAQTVEFMQSPKVAQGYLTAERAKVNAQLQQLEKEGVTEYNSAEEYRTKAQQLEQSKARLLAQLEKIDGAIAAINAQAEAAVARKNLNEAIRKRAAEFSKQLGANIVIFDSLEQIPESQALARQAYEKVGDDLDAWYDENTGDIYMNANAFEDMQRFEEKVFHEVVSHKGLDQLLGKAKYDKLCDAVWNSMSEASRNQYMAYARATHIRGSEKEFQRIAAKEYIAFLSEKRAALELNDQSEEANTIRSEWAKICEFLKDLFSKIFGNVQITDEDLAKLVHASFVNMQRQAQGITEEQGETNGVEAIFKPIMDAVAQWQGQPLINGLDPKKIGMSALNPDYARNKIRQIQELLNKPKKTAEDVAAIDGILGELYGALNTLIGSRQGGNENNNAESLINDIALQIAKSGAISQELLDSYVNEFAAAHNEEVSYGDNGFDSYIGGNSMWMRSALDRESGNTHEAEKAEKKRRKEEAAAAAAALKKNTDEQQAVIDQLSQESAVGTTFVDGKSTYTITGVAHENEDGNMVVPVHVEKNGKTRDFEEDAVVIANKMLKAKPAAPVKQETKEPEDHTAADFLNEALTETAKGNVPANVTIDETTIRDEEDSVEMDARLLIDGKPSNLSVTIFDQSLGSRGGYDPANLVKYYPFDNADNWSWEKADVLVNFFNKGEHSGKASVLDESDAVYFTSLQVAIEFAEFVNSDAANSPEVRLALAEAETDPNPTEAQKKAENYKQGHVTLWGLPITIENPKGSIRRGTDANGKQWEQEMHHTYGKIRRTEGVDGDHIDVFIGPNLTSDKVFVVDQRNVDTGEFDEHKCMLGFDSLEDAQNGYLSNYEEGWQGMGTVTEVTMDEFKKWIDSSHRKTKPFAEYKSVKTEGAASTAMEEQQAPTENRETSETPAEDLTPLEAAQKRKAAREAAKAAEQAAQTQGESEMLTRLRELQEGEDQQAPQDYLHSLTDEQLEVLDKEVNELWNKARTENNLRDLNDQQIREQYPEAWKTLLLRNRVSAENSRRWDMRTTEESIANRKAHTESEELRRYYEYEFAYMRASASKGDVLKAVHDAEEYLAGLSYEELAKIYNEIVRLQSEHDVPWILTNAYRARSANMENEGVFDYGLNHQGEIPEGKANKPKINANDWTAKDDLRPVMNGVYHDPTGVGVVTNAHILMATPSLYDPAQEGKIVKKDGSTVDGKFPNWQGVVDQARRINKKEATVDWTAIRNFIAGIKTKMKEDGNPLKKDSLANIIIRMPDGQVIIFRLNMFIPFADAAAAVGANTLHYSPINGQTLAENNGTQLVLMPVDPESFRKNLDWGYKDNFYYDLQPKQDEPVSAETPKTESKPERKPKPTRKKAAPAEQTQAPVETDAEVIETQKPKNTDKIEDVGEKIGGARKDIVQETVDRINVNGDTFAKIFPKFDYHKLIANGLEPRLAAGLKYVCEHAKKSYKIRKKRFGENNALEATRFMANYAKGYLLGDTSLDFTSEGWVFTAYGKRRYEFGIKLWESLREAMGDTMFDVDLSGYDCDVIQSEEERKAEAEEKGRTYRPSSSIYYRRNADGESVEFTPRYAINTPKGDKLFTAEEYDQAVQYFQDQVTSAINYQAANPFELAIYRKRGSDDCCVHAKIGGKWVELTPWGKEYGLKYRDEHRAELQAMAQRKAEELKEQRKNTRPEAKVEVKWFPGTQEQPSDYRIATKVGKEYVPISDPMLPKDIWRYAREHHDELQSKAQELLNAYLDEQEANRGWKPQLNIGGLRNRVGTDWRNGADVTAERFRTEFGFRGVEFGNYVTQKERQRLLNECFDALHDLAEILGVSPRALSLNGQLGFAIGARGGAGAKAHYEPGKNVINLTKKNGWGALAHEWWHAMDYYFGKREKERPATSGIFRDDVRKQMQDAFAAVMKAINGSEYLKRSQNLDAKTNKRYYAEDTELGARAFEDYIAKQLIERGQVNDFLSHHTSEEDWNGDISNYPYPIEKDGVALADAFQAFFDTVEEQEDAATGNGVLFSVTDKKYAQFALTQANNPMLDDVHTGIRTVEDIHTLEETLNDDKLLVTEPDWEEEDIRRAIEDNQVTIYSSKPIQDGTFVTPSRMVAEDYAGGEMVYEKTVSPDKVAWIASDEGQYADVDHYDGNILFSITNANNDIFYSNAERAVESIKQDKATPEQWRAMIEKAGGLKAGEDKWIGLSDWLAQQRPTIESHPDETPLQFAQRAQAERKKFTISKQEILHYIRANKIQIEETEYGETTPENNPTFRAFQDEVTEMWENVNRMQNGRFNEANQDIIRFEDDMQAKYGDDWRNLMDDSERNVANYLQERRDEINMEVFLPEEVVMEEMCNRHGDDFQLAFSIDDDGSLSIANEDAAGYYLDVNPINDTRLQYTTEGLTNKHEIAMTVPTIEAWNESDEIHFGDAGEGKVVAWARFGDAKTISKPEELAQAEQEYKEFSRKMIGQYGLTYTERVMSDSERQQESDLIAKLNQARKDHPQVEEKVLVIDEIQSNRHQEGREHGYVDSETAIKYRQLEKETSKAQLEYHDYRDQLWKKYENQVRTRGEMLDVLTPEEKSKHTELQEKYENLYDRWEEFKKNIPVSAIPAAPFEKNWHELAMKRILRFAAENGYDKVAWTTGDQQAARYNIGEVIDSITRNEDEDYPYSYSVMSKDHGELEYDFDENGIYHDDGDPELDGKSMSDVFGKELAKRLQEMPAGETIDNEGLRIGGEGMRGFYDDILPRFMQKYGKKWGATVGTVTMPQLQEGYQTMHAVDVTDEMVNSVMEGQPMFSITPKAERIEKLRNSEPIVVEYNGEYELNRKSAKDWAKKNIRGEYVNLDTQDKVAVSGVGIDEVLSHGEREEEHLKSIIAIPQMIKNSIFIEERGKEHENSRYERYKYYVCGLKIDGVDYTAKIVIGVKNGISYYDHQLTRIEKGRLIDSLNELSNPVANNQASKIDGKDKKLFSILQINPQENAENVQNSSENADLGEETPKNTSLDQVLFSITVNHNSPYLLKKADGSFVDPVTGERLGFDHRFMGTGEGAQSHGWGSYFSANDIRSYGEGHGFSLRDIKDIFNTSRWQSFGVGDAFDVAKNYLLEAHSEHARSLKKWLEDRLAQKQELLKSYEGKVTTSVDEDLMVFRAEADVQYIPALLRDMVKDIDTRNRHHYDVEIPQNNGTNYIEEDAVPTNEQVEMICSAIRTEQGKEKVRNLCKDGINGRDLYRWLRDERFGSAEQTSLSLSEAGFVGIHYDGRMDGECYVIFDENDAKIVDHVMFSITEKDPLKRWEAENPKPEAKEGEPTIDYAKRLQQWNNEHRKVKDAIKDAQPSYDHAEYDGVLFSTTPPFTGETIGDLYAGARQRSDLNRKRRESAAITDMLIQLSKDNYWRMQEALHKINADIRALRKAAAMQADLDRSQVEALLDLTNQLIQVQWGGGSDNPAYQPQTMATIIQQVRNAIGKADISEEVGKIEDYLVHAQRVAAKNQWDKLRRTPFEKLNISGVVTQGKVAIQGQHALKALNEALNSRMTVEQLEEDISLLYQKIDEATDESLRTQYTGRMIGYETARQHLERLEELMQERQQLRNELEASRTKKELSPAARRELEASIKEELRDNNLRQAEAYTQSVRDLQEYVSGQTDIAKNFIEQQRQRTEIIRGYAAKDLEGASADPHRTNEKQSGWRKIWDAFASPIRDLQSLLRLTGLHAPDGEGYLYNHFMRNWTDAADKERQGIVAAQKTLDAKISELTNGKYKTWEEAARDIKSKSHNKLSVSLWTGKFDGAQPVYEDRPIDAGNALYIYAVNKMNDGRMKLTAMNITDQKVRDLANQVKEMFGQEILDVVDWVQREFFSELRNRYNPTHEALFGAPMDAIENYFPLRINASARQKDEDITEPDDDTSRLLSGTSTGAIKRRKRNSLPLDVRNADFFQEVIRHVAQMERWNAFAQWTRDSNILFSDIDFRNKIKNMDTIYGKGDKLYTYMKKAFQTAVGVYKPQSDIFSEMTLNLAKGVTSAKINFRVFTALKQLASFPAFFTYMTESGFVKSYMSSWAHPHDTMKWAKANLPSFEKRVSKRDMGDMRLMQRSTDWEWNKRMLEFSQKYGMYANVLFDTLTCATGAKAVYESRLAEYKKKGYSTAVAESRARQDAEQAFNTSQQSSEGAYMAPVQMDRNIITAALTVFRTSPIQYTRNCFYHARNLIRKRGKGTKESMINFRTGQYIADGLTEEQARQAAEKDYNKSVARDIVGMVVYGALLGILWRMVGSLPYLIAGDDDDEKKKILKNAVTGGAIVQPVTGLLGGGIVESAIDGYGNIADMFSPELPFTQDLKKAFDNIGNDKYAEAASQALSVMMQSATGFDPNTVADLITRTVTTLDSDAKLEAAQKAWQITGAVLSIPQSQYEQIMLDDLVKAGKGIDMSNTFGKRKFEPIYDKYLSDFTTNREVRTAPLTWYLRSDEQAQKAEASAERRFRKLLKERGLNDLPDTKDSRDKKKR